MAQVFLQGYKQGVMQGCSYLKPSYVVVGWSWPETSFFSCEFLHRTTHHMIAHFLRFDETEKDFLFLFLRSSEKDFFFSEIFRKRLFLFWGWRQGGNHSFRNDMLLVVPYSIWPKEIIGPANVQGNGMTAGPGTWWCGPLEAISQYTTYMLCLQPGKGEI